MAKRLGSIMMVLCILIGVLCVPVSGVAAPLQEVNIRQIYLYNDAFRGYVDMKDADGASVPVPEPRDVYGSLDQEDMRVQRIQSFVDSGEGIAYIFLIDVSGSLSNSQFAQVKEATYHWAERMEPQDRMAIISFGEECKIVQEYTNDAAAVSDALDTLSNNDMKTQLYGGIEEAVKMASRNDTDLPKRKAVLLLSDGLNDFNGGITEQEAIQKAKDEVVPFYTLGVTKGNKTGESFMRTLYEGTNGTGYDLSANSISGIYQRAYDDLHEAYIIDFNYPLAKADGKLHNIKITIRQDAIEATDSLDCLLKQPTETLARMPIAASDYTDEGEESGGRNPIVIFAFITAILLIIAILIVVIALINRKKKDVIPMMANPNQPIYSPQDANIPRQEPTMAPAPAPRKPDGPGVNFTLHEIGGNDVKNGRVAGAMIIGRAEDCDLTIADPQISGKHCRLVWEQDGLSIEDLGSTNGTVVNGMTITGRCRLSSGDLLLLGNKEYRISY